MPSLASLAFPLEASCHPHRTHTKQVVVPPSTATTIHVCVCDRVFPCLPQAASSSARRAARHALLRRRRLGAQQVLARLCQQRANSQSGAAHARSLIFVVPLFVCIITDIHRRIVSCNDSYAMMILTPCLLTKASTTIYCITIIHALLTTLLTRPMHGDTPLQQGARLCGGRPAPAPPPPRPRACAGAGACMADM